MANLAVVRKANCFYANSKLKTNSEMPLKKKAWQHIFGLQIENMFLHYKFLFSFYINFRNFQYILEKQYIYIVGNE